MRCAARRRKTSRRPPEIANCRAYLRLALERLPQLRVIVALGRIAHESVLRALDVRVAAYPFAHGARHDLAKPRPNLFDSYHCSRYNTNTGVLTEACSATCFAAIRAELDALDGV